MTFWVAGAVAVAGIGSAVIGSNASKSAANSQANATASANQTEQNQYDQTRADNAPTLTARNDALTRLESLLGVDGKGTGGIDPATVMSDPGYQFGQQQGQRQLQLSENARGMRDSGAALKAASQFGTDYATTKYDDALNRQLNPLQSLAGLGQSGANTIAAAGTNAANQESNNTTAEGNALAASQIAQGNTISNAGNQLAGWYANNYKTPGTGYTYGGSSTSNLPDDIDAGGGWNPSDLRLKRGLVAVGLSPRGFTVYDWTWRDSGKPARGVIAQEVAALDSSAVRIGANGFLEVDYSKV